MRNFLQSIQISHAPSRYAIGAVATLVFLCGVFWHHAGLLGAGAVVLCLVIRSVGDDVQRRKTQSSEPQQGLQPSGETLSENPLSSLAHATLPGTEPETLSGSVDNLVEGLLQDGRYALLLRPQTNQHLTESHILRAVRQLDEAMALVPAGKVLLGDLADRFGSSGGVVEAKPELIERNLLDVEPLYLDRCTVTNSEYQRFVDAGGYEQFEYWHEEALPALLDFVDQTGHPGPRFWSNSRYPAGEGRLPVVGVSWYEAAAYAQWVGKRLPTDAEWTKAGAWPVESAPGRISQRRYPWGESFDIRRANLWGAGLKEPVDVDQYSSGTSVGGINQLVGNVWEWTVSPLSATTDQSMHVPEVMKSIRGGAYDTYFENQATCHFQSGEYPLSRRHNIGFRLALPMADLDPQSPGQPIAEVEEVPVEIDCPTEVESSC